MGPLSNPYEKYKQQNVMAANPVELIVMLYDGCIKQLKLADIAIEEKDMESAHNSFQKARNIVTELVMSLDFHYPIAEELMKIYEFLIREITAANMKKDPSSIETMVNILNKLKKSWIVVLKENKLIESTG